MEKLEVKNNLVLSDPCYKKNNGYNTVLSVKKGIWNADSIYAESPENYRISSILLIHNSCDFEKTKEQLIENIKKNENEEENQYLAVDSGTICICDEPYFDTIINDSEKYDRICDMTYSEKIDENFIPYVKTEEYKKYLEEMLKRIKNFCEKYNVEGNEKLLKKGSFKEEGLYFSLEFSLFRDSLTIKYYDENLVNETYKSQKNNTSIDISLLIKSGFDLWKIKCLIYEEFVKKEARNCISDIGIKTSCELIPYHNLNKKIEYQVATIVDKKCFVSATGYGDGFYPYCYHKTNGEIDGIIINFL